MSATDYDSVPLTMLLNDLSDRSKIRDSNCGDRESRMTQFARVG